MKNKLPHFHSNRSTLSLIMLMFLFFTGFFSFSQSTKKTVITKKADSKILVSKSIEKNPIDETKLIKNDFPEVPSNYTATKVTLSTNATKEGKAEFIKQYGQDYYYIFTDNNGKVVTKEEVEAALSAEQAISPKKIIPITNSKK